LNYFVSSFQIFLIFEFPAVKKWIRESRDEEKLFYDICSSVAQNNSQYRIYSFLIYDHFFSKIRLQERGEKRRGLFFAYSAILTSIHLSGTVRLLSNLKIEFLPNSNGWNENFKILKNLKNRNSRDFGFNNWEFEIFKE
jgi:hypothetical protein